MRAAFYTLRSHCLLSAVLLLGMLPVKMSAAPAPKPIPSKTEVPLKTVKVEFVNTPWRKVFQWLTDETGKPVITTFVPTGTFTFVGPPNKLYTIAEVVDILNEGLLNVDRAQPYELIHRQRSFTLIPADEQLDPTLLPRIRLDDLPAHGKSEYVSLVVPLGGLDVEDVLPYLKPMLSPGEEVVRVGGPCSTYPNHLVFFARVGRLREVVKWLEAASGSNR